MENEVGSLRKQAIREDAFLFYSEAHIPTEPSGAQRAPLSSSTRSLLTLPIRGLLPETLHRGPSKHTYPPLLLFYTIATYYPAHYASTFVS